MGWFQRDYQLSVDSLCNAEFSPCWALPDYIRALWLVCGSFQWRHGLLFTDFIVWDDKDKVIGFKRSHWIYLGWWNTGSPKLQLFLHHSIHTSPTVDWYLVQLTFHEIWYWNTKCSYLKVPEIKSYILSRGHRVFRRKKYFVLAVCLSKRYTKIPEVVFATSL